MDRHFDFVFENENVRTIVNDCNATWFVAADIAKILGYNHTPNMVRMLNVYEKGVRQVNTPGGIQDLTVITESGVNRCIFQSQKPAAARLRDWIYEVVMPSIHNAGGYISEEMRDQLRHDPEFIRSILNDIEGIEERNNLQKLYTVVENRPFYKEYKDRERRIKEMQLQMIENAPYEAMGKAFVSTNQIYNLDHLAKILNSVGLDIGRNRLCEKLRQDGYLMKQGKYNRPTQAAIDTGLMVMGSVPIDTEESPILVPMVTSKGMAHFINQYANGLL